MLNNQALIYSRSPKVGNPIASILRTNVYGIPALFGLNPVSNFKGLTVSLGFRMISILYLKGMRILMFQLSGFYCKS